MVWTDLVVATVPPVLLEPVVIYVLHEKPAIERLARPLMSEQALPHRAGRAVAPDHIVGLKPLPLLLLTLRAHIDVHPRLALVLAARDNPVIEAHVDEALPALQAMRIDNLDDVAQRQDGHAVGVVADAGHVDLDELRAVGDAPPADGRERRDGRCPEVIQQPRFAEDARRWHPVLRRPQPRVEPRVGFQHQRRDVVLCQK